MAETFKLMEVEDSLREFRKVSLIYNENLRLLRQVMETKIIQAVA